MVFCSLSTAQTAQTAPGDTQAAAPATQPANALSSGPVIAPVQSTDVTPPAELKPAWLIRPRLTVGETFTDNVNPGSGVKYADAVTELTPGIRIQGDTSRLKVYADLQASQYLYARGSYHQNTQFLVNSFGTLEALEKRLYLDFGGNVSQQSISAFGPQVASNALIDANRTEVSTFRLSPYLRGRMFNDAEYELRYASSWTHSNSALSSNINVQDLTARLKNADSKAKIGWSLEASEQDSAYSAGSRTKSDHVRSLGSYQVFPADVKLVASVGEESNNYTGASQSQTTYGYGLDWTPTERTLVSVFQEKRFFGQGHSYQISHRTPLTAFKFSDTKDVSVLPPQLATVGLGSVYDLYYAQLASAIPDPTLRAQAVSALLAQTGISPTAQVLSGYLVSSVSVLQRQNLSMVFDGRNNTATFTLMRTVQSTIGNSSGAANPALVPSLTQKGGSVSWAFRTTPLSSLTTTASMQQSDGGGFSSRQKTLNVSYTTRIKSQTNLTVGARTGTFSSNASPGYSENAALVTLSARF